MPSHDGVAVGVGGARYHQGIVQCANLLIDWPVGQRTGGCEDCGVPKMEHPRSEGKEARAPVYYSEHVTEQPSNTYEDDAGDGGDDAVIVSFGSRLSMKAYGNYKHQDTN